jgi:hypothetical protein
MWILDDIRPLRSLAAVKGIIKNNLTVYAAPDAYQINYRPATGYEWSVAGIYDAPNRNRGAAISFSVLKFPEKKKKEADGMKSEATSAPSTGMSGGGRGRWGRNAGIASQDSVDVKIYNDKNMLIRSLKWAADTGFNRSYWGMEEKGYRAAGSAKPKAGDAEPGGMPVFPGVYKVVLSVGTDKDSSYITVKDDPRAPTPNDVRISQRKMYDRLQKSTDKLNEVLDRLNEAGEVLTKMTGQLQNVEGSEADTLRKTTKSLQDSIKVIREFINGKASEKQGISRSSAPTVMTRLQEANMYIGGKNMAPAAQEEQLVINAETIIGEAVTRSNAFIAGPWSAYRKLVESTKVSLFKDYTPIQ